MFLQTYRKRADWASDQSQFAGNHDAERSWECHLQRGESASSISQSKKMFGKCHAILFILLFFFFSHYCVTLHFACTCLFLSWMCSLDPNRAGNAHDMQSARVQGVHRQWDDCHSGPDGQSYGDLWPRVLGRLTSETPLLLLAAENIKCFWSPTPVSRIWFSQSAR